MSKRSYEEPYEAYKKRKHNGDHSNRDINKYTHSSPQVDYNDAARRLPPAQSEKNQVAGFIPFKVKPGLPELPILTAEYAEAPFRHKSLYGYDRSTTTGDVTYERLEFLGDAYLEVVASRLIYHHFPQLTAGQQSQLRELLVKNETLAEYSRAYGFEEKLKLSDKDSLLKDAQNRGNKGINKILGDSFEAYVAAVILGDVDHGFAVAEKWLTTLWAPKLLTATPQHSADAILASGTEKQTYDPAAKATLQRRIMGVGIRLDYKPYKASVELKGDQLGQNLHFIAVYLTGYGHQQLLLGQGEGKNKVEAGNWAATHAMNGEHKASIEEWEIELKAVREAKKKALAEKAAEDPE